MANVAIIVDRKLAHDCLRVCYYPNMLTNTILRSRQIHFEECTPLGDNNPEHCPIFDRARGDTPRSRSKRQIGVVSKTNVNTSTQRI